MDKNISEKIKEELTKADIKNRADLDCFKRKIAKKYKITIPKNSDLLKIYHEIVKKPMFQGRGSKYYSGLQQLKQALRTRPVRSLSGVVNVSVLTKPYPCPGKCIYCPNQKDLPRSYLANEPAVQRAMINKFSPKKQVTSRINALYSTGHPIDKIDLRVIGGTWSYYPDKYQKWFIEQCFASANNFMAKKPQKSAGLEKEQKKNETAKARIVGLSIETRPDYITEKEIKKLRQLGVTKVELGVQSIYDDVLDLCQRGHKVDSTIKATKLLKNAGFKVAYQVMPNLPHSKKTSTKKNIESDVAMFKEIFSNPDFKPDYLKIYPLALIKTTPLYKLYKKGEFKPYNTKELTKVLIESKKYMPKWCRVERIIRDIPPSDIVEGGSSNLNLRAQVQAEMTLQGLKCQCIRCREAKGNYNAKEKIKMFREDYEASKAKEIFLTFEDVKRNHLFALLRLRLSEKALIREIHTYGPAAEINKGPTNAALSQHKGMGKKLLVMAEQIAKKADYKKIEVISGVGVRGYYRKLGYKLQNTYMVKNL